MNHLVDLDELEVQNESGKWDFASRWKCLIFFGLCLAIETLTITDQLATVKLCAYEGKEFSQ